MKFYKNNKGVTLIELIIGLAVFAQILFLVTSASMIALKLNRYNKDKSFLNASFHNSIQSMIIPAIRHSTGINYDKTTPNFNFENFNRTCITNSTINDELTLYKDELKKEFLTFSVEEFNQQSRLIVTNQDDDKKYLTNEKLFIDCFLISPSPTYTDSKDIKSYISPYIQIEITAKHINEINHPENYFEGGLGGISYKSTIAIRNSVVLD